MKKIILGFLIIALSSCTNQATNNSLQPVDSIGETWSAIEKIEDTNIQEGIVSPTSWVSAPPTDEEIDAAEIWAQQAKEDEKRRLEEEEKANALMLEEEKEVEKIRIEEEKRLEQEEAKYQEELKKNAPEEIIEETTQEETAQEETAQEETTQEETTEEETTEEETTEEETTENQ